ncbi:MAG: sulfatase [Planctomycetaceae bacterium]|nr:sulfatase [Planctomycetaceae bacterium]
MFRVFTSVSRLTLVLFSFPGVLLLAVSSNLSAQEKTSAKEQPRRNVVVIVADDLGMQLGCYGDTVARTPGVDRLAAHGTRFTRAFCTTASCSASRSVLMTGQFNHTTGHFGHAHGYNHFSTYESVPTLPAILGDAGYRTCSIGKYHLAPDYVYFFQDYRNDGTSGARNSVVMAANAKEWILEDDTKPFFLYWCSSDPHRGGGPGGFANFNNDPKHYPGVETVRFRPEDIPMPSWLPDNEEARSEMAEYYQAITRFDQGVDHLLNALVETGHWDDTLVMLLSDNGPPFPAAKTTLYQAGMNLPLIVRNPGQPEGVVSSAMVSWVDITPTVLDYCGVTPKPRSPIRPAENKGRADQSASAGGRNAVRPVKFAGRSFLDAVDGRHDDEFREVFASHTFHEITTYYPMRVVVEDNYKYIFNVAHQLPYPFASDLYASPTWQGVLKREEPMYGVRPVYQYLHRPRHELYDLVSDPDELVNLATQPEFAERLSRMQKKVQEWQKSTRDPWASKWEYE